MSRQSAVGLIFIRTLFVGIAASCGVPLESNSNSSPDDDSVSGIQEIESLGERATFRVTVQNVTAGNGLSPSLVVAHSDEFGLFKVGAAASPGIAQVAETGGTSLLEQELSSAKGVIAVAKAEGGPIGAGQTRAIEFTLPTWQVKSSRFNIISMIGRSNDSFVSAPQGIALRSVGRKSLVVQLINFDAGSEENTGNVEDFGPGGHPTANAEKIISYDRGLNPRGNAPEIAAWGPTAAVISIERL